MKVISNFYCSATQNRKGIRKKKNRKMGVVLAKIGTLADDIMQCSHNAMFSTGIVPFWSYVHSIYQPGKYMFFWWNTAFVIGTSHGKIQNDCFSKYEWN